MAQKKSNSSASEETTKKNIVEQLLPRAFRKSNRPKSMRELGVNVLKNLPANLALMQAFMRAINWKQAHEEVMAGLSNTVVIVGRPNAGKSTLFNKIMGKNISLVSPEAGTTRTLVPAEFGPFTLIDTPGHLPEITREALEQASVILLLLDGIRGLQAEDRELYNEVKALGKPTVIAVNKVDALPSGLDGDRLATEIAVRLGVAGVIPISAQSGQNIAEELIPAIIEASPEAALVIGRELPAFRRSAAQRIIRNATLLSLAAGLEPVPFIDIPIILGTQVRLVLRLAALYGEPISSSEAMRHARELVLTMAGGAGLRYLAEQAAKAVPIGGDLVAGAIAAAGTWAIGQVALEYYDSGKRLTPRRLRQLYQEFYRRFRRERTAEELQRYVSEAKDEQLLPEGKEPAASSGTRSEPGRAQ
ncbi:GTPase [Thermogemmatispora sp.]|uniref:GTPase n=1 Tax=Thermogemmatispora sp. TaxID=1968838 RepID=UPI001D1D9C3B|nr:GTPase [Thermogemmatispora sp.]MBX5450090.1 GTP-binding protein [Thermogemmatispora sp.]